MEGSKVHYVPSTVVDQLYELQVVLPANYVEAESSERKVVYVLDGQWNSTIVKDIAGKLSHDGMLPDPIVVAITSAGEGADPNVLRFRGFTPVEVPNQPPSGGAAQFLQVLETEIFPFVEANYSASSSGRVLTGASLGGLFTSYAMLERPDLFAGYVAISAPYTMAEEYFDNKLQDLPRRHLWRKRAYFGVGALQDNEEQVTEFVDALRSSVRKGPNVEFEVVPGVGHAGVEPIAYTNGLTHAFRRRHRNIKMHELWRYEGDYTDPSLPGFPVLTIEAGHGELRLLQDGEPILGAFLAETRTRFYLNGANFDMAFYQNNEGEVSFVLNVQREYYDLSPL